MFTLKATRFDLSYQIIPWPDISRSAESIASLVPNPYLGYDAEWNIRTQEPTILGVSDGIRSVSVKHSVGVDRFRALIQKYPKAILVGHNFLTADLPIVEELLGRAWPLEQTFDTILLWWLTNMHLCKGVKQGEDEEGNRRGRGWLNLWTMSSVHTNLANWKDCRGATFCEGPCPKHDAHGYNGVDSIAPVLALPGLLQQLKLYGLEGLYKMHAELMLAFGRMEREGVRVDLPYVEKLRADFYLEKLEYWNPDTQSGSLPFNPESPKQVKEFFKQLSMPDNQEETIRQTLRKMSLEHPLRAPLSDLLEYKSLGDGPDRWLAPKEWNEKKHRWEGFVDRDGFIHPHFGPYTSSGRCQCANPNLQNVEKRRIDRRTGEKVGVRVRRAFVPREGYYFVRGDFKNAENLSYLYQADPKSYSGILTRIDKGEDFHLWMADNAGIGEKDEFALRLGGRRDASKSVTHASDYLEGLQLKEEGDLRSKRIRDEVKAGARIIFSDWKFNGKVVTFTGANLADRAFGSKTWENRAKALGASERYFANFPQIRSLQRAITKQVEKDRAVRPPHGYFLKSFGYDEDRLKTAAAVYGSNPIAHMIKRAHLNMENHPNLRVVLTVHDELVAEVDKRHSPKDAGRWLKECMEIDTKEMPGFRLPVDGTFGENWAAKNAFPK